LQHLEAIFDVGITTDEFPMVKNHWKVLIISCFFCEFTDSFCFVMHGYFAECLVMFGEKVFGLLAVGTAREGIDCPIGRCWAMASRKGELAPIVGENIIGVTCD